MLHDFAEIARNNAGLNGTSELAFTVAAPSQFIGTGTTFPTSIKNAPGLKLAAIFAGAVSESTVGGITHQQSTKSVVRERPPNGLTGPASIVEARFISMQTGTISTNSTRSVPGLKLVAIFAGAVSESTVSGTTHQQSTKNVDRERPQSGVRYPVTSVANQSRSIKTGATLTFRTKSA